MGGKKKKSSSGPIKKESKYKIPARFDCPVCDTRRSINVKIQRNVGKASVYCRQCGLGKGKYWSILPLEKGVDVFFRFREQLIDLDKEYLRTQTADVNHNDPAGGYSNLLTSALDTERGGYEEIGRSEPPTASVQYPTIAAPERSAAAPVVKATPGVGLAALSTRPPPRRDDEEEGMDGALDRLLPEVDDDEDVAAYEDMFMD